MGRQQKSEKPYVSQKEHQQQGGFKPNQVDADQLRLPFDCCRLTLQHAQHPVATRAGHVYDLLAIVPWIARHHTDPLTSEPLQLSQLIRLHWQHNASQQLCCAATQKVLNEHSHVVCLATTGNVYHYSSVDEMCLKPKQLYDLIDSSPFKRQDVITLQDPLAKHSQQQHADAMRLRLAQHQVKETKSDLSTLQLSAEESQIVAQLSGSDLTASQLKPATAAAASQSTSSSLQHAASLVARAKYSSGMAAAGLTSSAFAPVTRNERLPLTARQLRLQHYEHIKKHCKGRKDFVRLCTNYGDLNLQLHSDLTPETSDNFIRLCRSGAYNGTLFHRLIPGFCLQGGDTTTRPGCKEAGFGGDSAFLKEDARDFYFGDECVPQLRHSRRGVLSMANTGPNTNASQFFILFQAKPNLDDKHAVFGQLVGGNAVLDSLEKVATGEHDRPVKDVILQSCQVIEPTLFDAEFHAKDEVTGVAVELPNAKKTADKSSAASASIAKTQQALAADNGSIVGRYLPVKQSDVTGKSSSSSSSKRKQLSLPEPKSAIDDSLDSHDSTKRHRGSTQ